MEVLGGASTSVCFTAGTLSIFISVLTITGSPGFNISGPFTFGKSRPFSSMTLLFHHVPTRSGTLTFTPPVGALPFLMPSHHFAKPDVWVGEAVSRTALVGVKFGGVAIW